MEEFDENQDGQVARNEIAQGIRLGVERQVDITMLVDSNDDGELSRKEHALSFPDPDGERGPEGFTPRQVQAFQFLDADKDGSITRQEVGTSHERTFLTILWAQIITHHLRRIDQDQDDLLRLEEFASSFGHDGVDALATEQRAWFDGHMTYRQGRPAIPLKTFPVQLLKDRPLEWRLALERPIRPLLVPACQASH